MVDKRVSCQVYITLEWRIRALKRGANRQNARGAILEERFVYSFWGRTSWVQGAQRWWVWKPGEMRWERPGAGSCRDLVRRGCFVLIRDQTSHYDQTQLYLYCREMPGLIGDVRGSLCLVLRPWVCNFLCSLLTSLSPSLLVCKMGRMTEMCWES